MGKIIEQTPHKKVYPIVNNQLYEKVLNNIISQANAN